MPFSENSDLGPQYHDDIEDDDSISSDTSSNEPEVLGGQNPEALSSTGPASEYDEDVEDDDEVPVHSLDQEGTSAHKWELFRLDSGINYIPLNDDADRVILGLKQGQDVMIAGSFQLQILKGGIKFNDVHYNASQSPISIWHPSCSSMSPISSSFYAGWNERTFITSEVSKTRMNQQNFECILLISNRCTGLLDIAKLDYVFRNLWVSREYFSSQHIKSSRSSTFVVLSHETMRDPSSVSTLNISRSWSNKLAELSLFHQRNSHDMRIMVLGGKNSGKSTFLRLLLQKLLHVDNEDDESLFYLDIDPGQTEFSRPECISLSGIQKDLELGNPLGQSKIVPISERYLGTNNPSVFPTQYLAEVSELIDLFTGYAHMGTTLLNVPGWVKGFGIQIMNSVIRRFKPTHILLLGSEAKTQSLLSELQIDPTFSTPLRENYEPEIDFLDGYHGTTTTFSLKAKIQPHHLRQFRLLSYFHRLRRPSKVIEYDFTPLIKKAPLRVSFGSLAPVKAFKLESIGNNWTDANIKDVLEGTVVGVYKTSDKLVVDTKNSFPILKENVNEEFFGLGLIHSIDIQGAYLNIYLPFSRDADRLKVSKSKFIIKRCKTEAPVCELYPQDGTLQNERGNLEMPFVSFRKPKKYEYVWKVRRNIQRRGHLER
ncbi:LAME_0H16798g1_1 [Lachancea meyersii CBS 8951]|uniref:Polynucleotide 5'-hydroxyl-kinase GRC3 n=1 Tax=Lachancea meyersii CBS 8951 TaxID=1266667 RepID=A0A1G4KI50_9SACH|nr:LAME_0H16798g1_1 [Lachancea meyersii CBS 8951]